MVPQLFPRSSSWWFFLLRAAEGHPPAGDRVNARVPRNPCVECQTPNVMVFGGWAFGTRVAREGGALTNEVSVLVKEAPARSRCSFCHVRTQREDGHV